MSRYRPPAPKSSPYITADGAAKLRAEVRQLWKVERPQVTQVVHEAAKVAAPSYHSRSGARRYSRKIF